MADDVNGLSDKALSIFAFAAYHRLVSGEKVTSVIRRDGAGHEADPEGDGDGPAPGGRPLRPALGRSGCGIPAVDPRERPCPGPPFPASTRPRWRIG